MLVIKQSCVGIKKSARLLKIVTMFSGFFYLLDSGYHQGLFLNPSYIVCSCIKNIQKKIKRRQRVLLKLLGVIQLTVRAINSAGEYPLDVRKATGSNPVLPTIQE